MVIFVAQANPAQGNLKNNFALIADVFEQARKQRANICLLPELITTGYLCRDLFLKTCFLEEVKRRTDELILQVKGDVILLLPTIIEEDNALYNAVIAIKNGKILAISKKKHLPNYGLFDEKRYFTSGRPEVINIEGLTYGIAICEDFWQHDVWEELKAKGAQILLVPNASPYEIGKAEKRQKMAETYFNKFGMAVIYCNTIGAQDGIIFDGRSFIYDKNNLTYLSPAFMEDYSLIDIRQEKSGIALNIIKPKFIDYEISKLKIVNHNDKWEKLALDLIKKEEIKQQTKSSVVNYREEEEIYGAMLLGLSQYAKANNFRFFIIGLSGGLDSALTAALATDCFGADNVLAIMLESEFTSQNSKNDAKKTAELLGVKYKEIDLRNLINNSSNIIKKEFSGLILEQKNINITEENLQSRLRGMILMSFANLTGGLLITTGNKSENAVGYCTIYGDMCGGFSPLKDLYKTNLLQIAIWRNFNLPAFPKILNSKLHIIPNDIILKAPSAELSKDQEDRKSLPDYPLLDKILYLYIEQDLGKEEIKALGFDKIIVENIIKLVNKNEFKRKQSATGIKLSSRCLEKERRYSNSQQYSEEN